MTTNLSAWTINYDQDISVSMTFDIDAEGNQEAGWTITKAVLVELATWLDCDQAEEPQIVCVDKTRWLEKFLAAHDCERRALEAALAEQFDDDHADDHLYANPTWRQAVALCVE